MIGWRPVALVVLAAVLIAVTFMDVGSAAACGHAQGLLDSGRYAEARTAFIKLLDDDATDACADRGLDEVARQQCARAGALEALGRTKESVAEYTEIATAEPVRAKATCRKALDVAPAQTCEAAAGIDAAAYPQKAWTAYVGLLDDPKQEDCATEALTQIGTARCRAARALLAGREQTAARKELFSLATTEPLLETVTKCAVKALR